MATSNHAQSHIACAKDVFCGEKSLKLWSLTRVDVMHAAERNSNARSKQPSPALSHITRARSFYTGASETFIVAQGPTTSLRDHGEEIREELSTSYLRAPHQAQAS